MAQNVATKIFSSIDCGQGAVRAVRYNADGNYCITCGSDKTIKLWNPNKELLIKKYTGHGSDVLDACGSCDNAQLASGGSDKTVIYWDVGSGQIMRRYRGHVGKVNCVQFNEESTTILSGSVDSSIRAWDCRSRKPTPYQIMDEAKDSITSLQVNDHEILSSSVDGKVRRYDIRTGKMFSDFIGSAITYAVYTKDSQCVLASSHDHTIRLLDVDSGEMLGEYTGHKNSKYMIECGLNAKDDHVISGSEDGFIYIWDLIEAKIQHKIKLKENRVVHSISHHPEEVSLLAAMDNSIIVIRSEEFEPKDKT
ncbi:WD repeat domain-containing protein 83-like [Styela clava]